MTDTDTEPLAPWEIELVRVPRLDTVSRHTRRMILHRALLYLAAMREREAAYEREVEYWHRQGYRAHYCPHGTDLWVDYDNICGGCESAGESDPRKDALNLAWRDHSLMAERSLAALDFLRHDPPVDSAPIWAWACEPMMGDLR